MLSEFLGGHLADLGAKSKAHCKDRTRLVSSHHEDSAENSLHLPDLTDFIHQNLSLALLRECFQRFLRGIPK